MYDVKLLVCLFNRLIEAAYECNFRVITRGLCDSACCCGFLNISSFIIHQHTWFIKDWQQAFCKPIYLLSLHFAYTQ
nr:MAG TPA: Protein of unknown function (DUF1619) [Bacteriophage sp.]